MQAASHTWATTRQRRVVIRFLFGFLVGLTGITNMLSAIVPKVNWDMFFGMWPADVHYGVHKLIVVCGFFLLMLCYGLIRGKRQAWYISTLMLLFVAFLTVLSGSSIVATLLIGMLGILLLFFAAVFRAKSDPPSVRRGTLAFLIGLGIVTIYTIGGFFLLYQEFEPFVDRLGIDTVILLLVSNTHLYLSPGTQAFFFGRALPLLCLSAVISGLFLILRPVAAAFLPNEQEQTNALQLTHRYGKNSISYFALEHGKSYFFSSSGKSVISYVLEGRVVVVVGDPIGPEEEAEEVIQQFIDFCREQDWTMVFWQVRKVLLDLYRAAGLHCLKIGEDAVVETKTFTLAGKAMANVRSSAKRAEKEGLHIAFYRGRVLDAEQLAQMEGISQAWLAKKGGSEMGFSMGRFEKYGDCEQVTAVVVSECNRVHAFVTFVPVYGRNGWALDLMRRAEQAAPGTMELLLAGSIEHLKANGASVVSLGLAPVNTVSTIDESFLQSSIEVFNRLLGNEEKNKSLFNFKKKFQPTWESRYLIYSSTLTLPMVSWALYHAHQRDSSLLKALYREVKGWRMKRKEMHERLVEALENKVHTTTLKV